MPSWAVSFTAWRISCGALSRSENRLEASAVGDAEAVGDGLGSGVVSGEGEGDSEGVGEGVGEASGLGEAFVSRGSAANASRSAFEADVLEQLANKQRLISPRVIF